MSSEADKANLRFIRDYAICHGTAPTHTTTYSRGTFPEDLPWDFGAWRDSFRIKILEIAEDDMVFDMTGIDVSLVLPSNTYKPTPRMLVTASVSPPASFSVS